MLDYDYIKEHTLLDCLMEFKGVPMNVIMCRKEREDVITNEFNALAKKLLYGGYIMVGEEYRIEIKAIEFYFHEETISINQIEDPMVYHRNGKFPNRTVPPLPIMTLHSHWSGFDIAFEDPDGQYRASALIRAYAVYDIKGKGYIKWDASANKDEKGRPLGWFSLEKEPYIDSRSTYLQFYLNGFSMDGKSTRIEWKDDAEEGYGPIKSGYRKNVEPKRLWAFKR